MYEIGSFKNTMSDSSLASPFHESSSCTWSTWFGMCRWFKKKAYSSKKKASSGLGSREQASGSGEGVGDQVMRGVHVDSDEEMRGLTYASGMLEATSLWRCSGLLKGFSVNDSDKS